LNRNVEVFSYQLKKQRQRKLVSFIVFSIILYIFINLITAFVICPVRQNSVSMIPDVAEKSIVMTLKAASNYERGNVVLLKPRYQKEAGFFLRSLDRLVSFFTARQISILEDNNSPSTKAHIRRIVGMPGDTIYMRDYVLYIKPRGERLFLTEFEIIKKPYNVTFYVPPADWNTEIGVKGSFDEIRLGEDEYFILADNRKSSDDSRLWGSVKKSDIQAKVLFCYFPFKNFRMY